MADRVIFIHADVVTMVEAAPSAEAMVTEGEKILYVGDEQGARDFAGEGSIIRDMEGKTILPGFVDGHSHMVTAAYEKLFFDVSPSPKGKCDSVEELIEELSRGLEERRDKLREGEWFIAMGYDNAVYPDGRNPTRLDLDLVSREIPICVTHASGHCAVFNSKALELCGIDRDYLVPEGGAMPKLPGTQEYSGLLQEKAFFQQTVRMTFPGTEEMVEAVGESARMYASRGFTTVQEGKAGARELELSRLARKRGKLPLDLVCYISFEESEEYLPKKEPWKTTYEGGVRIAGYKLFLDGSPQAKTAWLTKPYYQPPEGENRDYRGFARMTDEEVTDCCERCLANRWQMNVHTNGDAAIDQLIRCYRKALEKYPDAPDLRPVSIHCQTVREDQLDEMKRIGMLASFFCDHVYYWGDYHYESSLGPERAERISPVRSAVDKGISYTLHQDTPVVEPNALFAVHNAVNRVTRKGRVLGKEQRVSPGEALRGVTINAAYQLFEEKDKGSLVPGKAADLVVLSGNPLKVSAKAIKDIQVLETIKGGRTIFQA